MRQVIDMMGRQVQVPDEPKRIISLVPSLTETLFDLGMGDHLAGCTKFCVHPPEARKKAAVVGGTKQIHYDRIAKLHPDLIIGNKEENERSIIETLEKNYPVWMSDIGNLNDAEVMIQALGELTCRTLKAEELVQRIRSAFSEWRNQPKSTSLTVLYLIWQNPWMGVGRDTFIHHMLEVAGFKNVLEEESRYPEISMETIHTLEPDVLLLSSEPYPFKDQHGQAFRRKLKRTHVSLVNGELFSWYGSRLVYSPAYFARLHEQITPVLP